jgi:N-acetylneuraminic acid mutarotase
MVVWGGRIGDTVDATNIVNTGGIYDPVTDTWTATNTGTNVPAPRFLHNGVWTGKEFIVFGGRTNSSTITPMNSGAKLDPVANTWASMPNMATNRLQTGAVWTGSKILVWGGCDTSASTTNSGEAFNPSTNSWSNMATASGPGARQAYYSAWTGTKYLIYGGHAGVGSYTATDNIVYSYDPAGDSWTSANVATNNPGVRYFRIHAGQEVGKASVWTGTQFIVFGGMSSDTTLAAGGAMFNPATNTWTTMSTTNALSDRHAFTMTWTGRYAVIWGGLGNATTGTTPDTGKSDGKYFDPVNNSWAATPTNATVRQSATSVWTGSKVIIFGGFTVGGNAPTTPTNTAIQLVPNQ